MSKTEKFTEKVFTTRHPNYTKKTSPSSQKAEAEMNDLLGRNDIESTAQPHNEGKLLVLFIHGFAASKYCWLDPDIGNMGWVKDYRNDPEPIDWGWHAIPPPPYVPVDWTLSKHLVPVGASTMLDQKDIAWLTYSQKSAFGDIKISVEELKQVITAIKKIYGERKIIIIAHSRGGLISKSYLDYANDTNVEKLITFGSPFGGTFMSAMELFRLPSKHFLNRVKTARKLWDVSQERKVENIATNQMAPNSDFLTQLIDNGCREGIQYVNVAGSCSHITNVYVWRWSTSSWKRKISLAKKKNELRKELIKNNKPPVQWYTLPSISFIHAHNWILEPYRFLEIYPKIGYPEVLLGDGAVSVRSALLDVPCVKQYIIHRNHIDMTCCKEGYDIMLNEIELSKKMN
ncbi:MAG: alpha/beta hydrolase [Candidatus Heimdallarchaeota archaeon]|nr:alpha/beta hydrolase [Candidatus Heimdallarchaeota archaeon]